MQQELRFATFNVCNLAPPGIKFYDDQEAYTESEYKAKLDWTAGALDRIDADVIGFQEIFAPIALHDVLARTQKYRNAQSICFDAGPQSRPAPRVALVSRLPLASAPVFHSALPRNLAFVVPGTTELQASFTRRVLQARLLLPAHGAIDVFVCHLKSKRPDYRNNANLSASDQLGLAILRSLLRRGADALGLRMLLTGCMAENHSPLIVMGDFNDTADAVSTQIVLGAGQPDEGPAELRLYDSYRIQTLRTTGREVGYTHAHNGNYETIDHILVSREFNPDFDCAIGEVEEVVHMNDHIGLELPQASDHGSAIARIKLIGECAEVPAAI